MSWIWSESARESIRYRSFCIETAVSPEPFGDSTWMVKFAMNHRGLGPRGWRIISRVAGVLLVIPQRSAGDPNQQPTINGSRYQGYLKISCWMLDVRSFRKAEYNLTTRTIPLILLVILMASEGGALQCHEAGDICEFVEVVKRCRTTKWFDSKFDSLASVLDWASMIASAPTPKSEYKSTGICRFLNVPCKFLARLLDSNLTLWLPWKS